MFFLPDEFCDFVYENKLHEIEVKVNHTVHIRTKIKKFSHLTNLYKKLNFLKLSNIYKSDLVKFMHKLFTTHC